MNSVDSNRPLSPHVQVYRWQITMSLSILHRMSGVFLGLGGLILAWWMFVLAWYPEMLSETQQILFSIPGQTVLLAIGLAFSFHFCNGIRHLFWDIGKGFEIATFTRSGWLVVIFSLSMTAFGWVLAKGTGL